MLGDTTKCVEEFLNVDPAGNTALYVLVGMNRRTVACIGMTFVHGSG